MTFNVLIFVIDKHNEFGQDKLLGRIMSATFVSEKWKMLPFFFSFSQTNFKLKDQTKLV